MIRLIGFLLCLVPVRAGEIPFLKERGLSFDLVYTGEVMGPVSGGIKDDQGYLDNLDVILNYEKRNGDGNGWSGVLYLLYNSGYDPSEDIGDVQTTSNIETYDTARVFEAWVQRHYGAHNLLFGLFDVNSEFDVIDTAQLFLNSSHGIGPDFSQAGENGPSIFPSTSLAFRYLYDMGIGWQVRGVVADGVPGDPDDPKRTHIKFEDGDGTFAALEVSYRGSDESWHVAAGIWNMSGEFPQLANSAITSHNDGAYVLGEKDLGKVALFARYGAPNREYNEFTEYHGMGVVFQDAFGRRDDQLGLALANVKQHTTDVFETNIELTWRIQIGERIAIQPDVQFIMDAGFDESRDDVWVAGLRFELVLF